MDIFGITRLSIREITKTKVPKSRSRGRFLGPSQSFLFERTYIECSGKLGVYPRFTSYIYFEIRLAVRELKRTTNRPRRGFFRDIREEEVGESYIITECSLSLSLVRNNRGARMTKGGEIRVDKINQTDIYVHRGH